MSKVSRRVRFYEIRAESGSRLRQIDYEKHFFDPIAQLPKAAPQHWESETGLRIRGRVYRQTPGPKPRQDLVILDRVHRQPTFKYVHQGTYSDHAFDQDDKEFAEPKFLAFFERNILGTFTSGVRMPAVGAALNTWRAKYDLAPIALEPVTDIDRLLHLQEARGGAVARLEVALPADAAGRVYRNRQTPVASFMRSRAMRDGMVTTLSVDPADSGATGELLE